MSKLLDILPQCGSQAFDTFCEVLSDTNQFAVDVLESPLPLPSTNAPEGRFGLQKSKTNLCSIS